MLRYIIKVAGVATLGIALAGCGSSERSSRASSGQGPAKPLPKEATGATDALAAADDLAAGLTIMHPRLKFSGGGLGEVIVLPENRFLMHPDLGKPTVAKFDVSGLSTITLSPRIKDLSADEACVANAAAGVVGLAWSAGLNTGALQIDRHYDQLIEIKLEGAEQLELKVDDGNGVITCDWFTIGFLDVI